MITRIGSFPGRCRNVYAVGHGCIAYEALDVVGGFVQSMRPNSFLIFGAFVLQSQVLFPPSTSPPDPGRAWLPPPTSPEPGKAGLE